jgi:phosphoribosyl-ATP pyrophosphohydrolase/phosphoribosyl-AMP cyclohydrolase
MKDSASFLAIDWTKGGGLVPAIIQHQNTKDVLMLGYMNEKSFNLTRETGIVHFFSRSRQCLWKKGETSGHRLRVCSVQVDCDADTVLVVAHPEGPACHRGTESCFGGGTSVSFGIFSELESVIAKRWMFDTNDSSYVSKLKKAGHERIAQKFGEEAVETLIAALSTGGGSAFVEESADMFFHWLVLARSLSCELSAVAEVLASRRHRLRRPDPAGRI